MSIPASSLIRSNGKPHTWTHIDKLMNLTILAVKPFSHLCRAKILLSKLYSLLSQTNYNWLSKKNLNWIRPSPISIIFRSLLSFHNKCRRFFAALRFKGRVVKNFPIRLREYSSRILSLLTDQTVIGSSSSDVWVMCWIRSMKSKSIERSEGIGKDK